MKRVVRATAYLVMPDLRYGTVWGVCTCIYYHTERRIMRECLWLGGTVRGMRFFGLPPTRTWELHNKQITMTNTPPPLPCVFLRFCMSESCARAALGWCGRWAEGGEGERREEKGRRWCFAFYMPFGICHCELGRALRTCMFDHEPRQMLHRAAEALRWRLSRWQTLVAVCLAVLQSACRTSPLCTV